MSLLDLWDRLPLRLRDAAGRFVKVLGAAGAAAAVAYIFGHVFDSQPISPGELWAAVVLAVVSAAEKFFNIAPKAAAKVRRT